jgi:hypothetical protein
MKARVILVLTLVAPLLACAPARAIRVDNQNAEITDEQKRELFSDYTQSFCPALEHPDKPEFSAVFNVRFLSMAIVPDELMKTAEKTREEVDAIMAAGLVQTFLQGELRNCSPLPAAPSDCFAAYNIFEPSIMGGIPEEQLVKQLKDAHAANGIVECMTLPVSLSGLGRDTIETLPFLIGWNGRQWRSLGFLKQNLEPSGQPTDPAPGPPPAK